jgi:DNA-binding Lrp family transcriptional regulator
LDSLDVKILKELVKNNVMPFPSPALRKSFRTIGKDLRVDQGTVRNRIRKFEQSGLINRFYLGVNPSIFGLKIGALFFDVRPESEKENLKRKISAMDKILLLCDYLGPKLSAVFCYSNNEDLKKITRQIIKMANSEEVICQDKPFLPCNELNLTSSDWKILNTLQKADPWKISFSSVAGETGLSTKTTKNRIQRLVEEGAVYLLVSMNLESFEGFVPADLNIVYESPEYRDRVVDLIREYLGDMLVFADVEDKQHANFAIAAPSIARVRAIENWMKSRKGVRNARVDVLHEILSISRFYDEEVRKSAESPRGSTALKVHNYGA